VIGYEESCILIKLIEDGWTIGHEIFTCPECSEKLKKVGWENDDLMEESICYKCEHCYYWGIARKHFCKLTDDGRCLRDMVIIEDDCRMLKDCSEFSIRHNENGVENYRN